MVDKNNIKTNESTTADSIGGARDLLNQIYLGFCHGLKPLMISYFDAIDDILFEMAEKAGSDKKQKLYFESLKSIRIHKFNVLSSFLGSIKQVFNLFEEKEFEYFEEKVTTATKTTDSDTAPFDKNDVDEKLTQNSLIHKFEISYKDQLFIFDRQFSELISSSLRPHFVPVGPYVIVSMFAKSIRLLHLDLNIKLILYKHFELTVMTKIKGLYQQINQQFIDSKTVADVLPRSSTAYSAKGTKHVPKVIATPKMTASSRFTIDEKTIIKELNSLYQELFNDKKKDNEVTPLVIQKALMVQLERIQLNDNRRANHHDVDTINLMTMLFQLIAEDENIPESIQKVVVKLQIPYLKAAIKDKEFLGDKHHPAKKLLEFIAKTSIGWSMKLDADMEFINNINITVNSIVEKKNLTTAFFDSVLKNYQEFIKIQKNDFEKEQERIKIKEMGRNKIAYAMKTVDALLTLKLENVTMPAEIKSIVLGPWKNLLSLLLVRYSNTSKKYLRMVTFIDDLIKVVESKQFNLIIKTNIEKLLEIYQEGLELVAYNGDELIKRKNNFKQSLLKIHKLDEDSKNKLIEENELLNKVKTKTYGKIPKSFNQSEESTKTIIPDFKGFSKEDVKLLEMFKLGIWAEFPRPNNSPVKAQLSWISPSSGKYIFVNSRGLKVTDKNLKQLVSGLKDDSIILLD